MRSKKLRALTALIIVVCSFFFPFRLNTKAADTGGEYEQVSLSPDVKVSSRILELLFGKGDKNEKKNGDKDGTDSVMLAPGGDIFGAKIKQNFVTVVEAKGAGKICAGDRLIMIGEEAVKSVEDVKRIVGECDGNPLKIYAMHGTERICAVVTPERVGDEYRIGLSLRDGAAGIGTVTFYDPETGLFGGLGHGICDAESTEIVEMLDGSVTGVILGGVQKGAVGKPGELCGVLTGDSLGVLYSNTECGVFGKLDNSTMDGRRLLPIAKRSEVHSGDATIISTVKNGKKAEFSIKIVDVDTDSTGTKSFKIKVTDKALLALTGGIVRGMSGSPIIQNGKLVGAVTHVMVADPTEGYGIFIENMLNAAQMPLAKAS